MLRKERYDISRLRRSHDRALGSLGCADGHVLLDLCNCLTRVEVLGAGPGAVHDGVASVERKGVLELLSSLLTKVVTRVGHPSVRLHEHGGAKVLVLIPPVRGAGCGAARAQNALVQTVESTTLLGRLKMFTLRRGVVGLEERLDGSVLLVELGQVWHEVLDNVHVRQGVDLGVILLVDPAEAGEGVDTVNIHSARTADTLTARATEGERRVNFVLDFDERVENHWTGLVEVQCVRLQTRLLRGLVRVPSVDLELLQVLRLARTANVVRGGCGETGSGGCGKGSNARRAGNRRSESGTKTVADVE